MLPIPELESRATLLGQALPIHSVANSIPWNENLKPLPRNLVPKALPPMAYANPKLPLALSKNKGPYQYLLTCNDGYSGSAFRASHQSRSTNHAPNFHTSSWSFHNARITENGVCCIQAFHEALYVLHQVRHGLHEFPVVCLHCEYPICGNG